MLSRLLLQAHPHESRHPTRIPPDGDYAQPAAPTWRGIDWSAYERDATLASGRRLHYLDCGEGERCFVLVHGMGGRWQHWLEVIPALALHGRVLAVDLPGFGRSESLAPRVSLDGIADAIAEMTRLAKVERAVLIGHSMGGPVAIRAAARLPTVAEAIVSAAGAVYQFSALAGMNDVIRFARRRPRETAAIAMEIATAGIPVPGPVRRLIVASGALRSLLLAPYVLEPTALRADVAHLIVDGVGARGVLPTARAVGPSDAREGLDRIACPILSLAADRDRIAPLPDTEAFQRDVPHARTVVLEECGHMPMLERPRAFSREVLRFVDAL